MSRPKPTVILDVRKYKVYFLKDPRKAVPFYVGLTKTTTRPYQHIIEAESNYCSGNQWKLNTIRKIINDGFDVEIIWVADKLTYKEACFSEKCFIRLFGRKDTGNGFLTNMTDGGDGFTGKHTIAAKQKISESLKHRSPELREHAAKKYRGDLHSRPLLGTVRTEEQKKKQSETIKKGYRDGRIVARDMTGSNNPFYGKHHSEETKQRISEWKSENYKGSNNPFYGKHHSEETKTKMIKNLIPGKGGEYLKGKPWPAARRAAYEKKKSEKENQN